MRPIHRSVIAGILLAVGATACSAAATPSGPPSASAPAPVASASPASTPLPTPPPPTSPPEATPIGDPTGPPAPNEAPVATLVAGASRFGGEVGGFSFGSYSQSAPWLPAGALDRVEVPAGAALGLELDDRATIADWAARYAAAADVTADRVVALGTGGAVVSFGAPPVGDWVVSVTVTYGGGLGSGAYYWHVVVS